MAGATGRGACSAIAGVLRQLTGLADVATCTPDGRIVYADINPASEVAYGMSRDQVVGRTVEDVLGVEAARVPLAHLRECLRTGQPQRYVARRTLAGRTTTIDVMFVLVPEVAPGGDRFIITTARDLTEREKLEAQLRQAQKMEAVGQLTGGVAHDFNNLLAIIGGNAELAKRRPAGDTTRQMDNILRATERGVALTRQLLSFSRRHVATPQLIDLRAEMPRMAEMLRASLRGNIQMRIDVADHLWPIEVDVAELEMALAEHRGECAGRHAAGRYVHHRRAERAPGPATQWPTNM